MPSPAPLDFLRAIGLTPGVSGGLVHLALDAGRTRLAQNFVPVADEARLRAVIDALAARNATESSSVVFGVNARVRQQGRDVDVPAVTAMALDFDAQKVRDPDLFDRFVELASPTVLVASGTPGNGHFYWRFREPVEPGVARSLMRRLCKGLGADPSWPPSKMMRLPGSQSWKDDQPRPVEVVSLDPAVQTTPDAFAAALDALGFADIEPPVTRSHGARTVSGGALPAGDPDAVVELLDRVPAWVRGLVVLGEQDGDRSAADFNVICRLLEFGADEDDIIAVFAAYPDGIGARTRESGLGYLYRTIDVARSSQNPYIPVRVLAVGGNPDRMVLDLHVLAGEREGLRFPQGVDDGSSVWRWVFQHAGVPVPQTLEDRSALTGRVVGVQLGMTSEGLWQVTRWGRADAGGTGDGAGTGDGTADGSVGA
jgi:hypothetical protein